MINRLIHQFLQCSNKVRILLSDILYILGDASLNQTTSNRRSFHFLPRHTSMFMVCNTKNIIIFFDLRKAFLEFNCPFLLLLIIIAIIITIIAFFKADFIITLQNYQKTINSTKIYTRFASQIKLFFSLDPAK